MQFSGKEVWSLALVPFYTMFAPVVGKDLAELLAEGASYSLPVSAQRAGRLFDALFLFKPELGLSARPTGWMLLDCRTGKLAVLADCEIMDFALPDLLPPKEAAAAYLKDLTPKKQAQLRARINDCYDEMRGFAFSDTMTPHEADIVKEYKELFLTLSAPEHYPFYYALSPAFFTWLRLPLPLHKASAALEDQKLLEDPAQAVILGSLSELVTRFRDKIETDAHKQSLFDEMHAELQEYKNGMLDKLTLSMELDVIKLIDDVERSIAVFSARQSSPEDYGRLFAILAGVATDLEDLLYRHGVEPYRVSTDKVDVTRQKILSTTDTGDASLDKKVAKRMSRGWEKQGKIIRPERISVYLYQQEGNKA
jgi:molecular chaperone GrpE (heat shock protein)